MEETTMSDNKTPKKAATNPPEKTTDTVSKNETAASPVKSAAVSKSSSTHRKVMRNNEANQQIPSKPSNKRASLALLLAGFSIIAAAGHFIWQQHHNKQELSRLTEQNQQALKQSQAQLKQDLITTFNNQLAQQKSNSQSQADADIAQQKNEALLNTLSAQINQLEQQVQLRQPDDWLIHEADYLIRIAARTMWLEQDTQAAISLLREADSRLKTLAQAKYLPIRALINEDIEALALMPSLNTEDAILQLMALNKQIPQLTLAQVKITEDLKGGQESLTLSTDIDDWQSNLAKTWQKFLNDFITVRRRTGSVEPLLSPDQQQHLKQNLSLKVQLVQWAASQQKDSIYQQTLLDIQQWLNEFFDMQRANNQTFYQAIEDLKQQTIDYNYPSDLKSLTAIKRLLESDKQQIQRQYQEQNSSALDNTQDINDASSFEIDDPEPLTENNNGDLL
jgi:uroporphyrin-3 C-methyltransferase